MTYLDFLNKLLALGSKFPAVWAIILRIVADVEELVHVINPKPAAAQHPIFGAHALQAMAVEPKETEAEHKLAALMRQHGSHQRAMVPMGAMAIGDGSILNALRAVWQFIQANPALLQLILSLFKVAA